MLWAEVDWNICRGCDPCVARLTCKTRAIVKYDGDELAYIELDRCRGCAKCLPACSYRAIRMSKSNQSQNVNYPSPD